MQHNVPQTLGADENYNGTVLVCPVCSGREILTAMPHLDFKGACVFICADKECGHGWTDYKQLFISDKQFVTYKPRADKYCEEILLRHEKVTSILDIGSANDFYFLRKIHERKPEIQLFVHDVVDYSNQVPSFITFTSKLEEMDKVDLVYMCHSLEHVIEINEFLELLREKCKTILIEVPSNPVDKWQYVRKGEWPTAFHYHFFNEISLPRLFLKHGFRVVSQREADPPGSTVSFPFSPTHNLFIEVEA